MVRTRHAHVPAFALGASLFGKLPTALDFVRVNHDYPESIELDRWLQAGLQRLAARGQAWPPGFLQFVFVAPSARHALIGVVAPSRDRAGRRFPLTMYGRVPMTALAEGTALLPLASEEFIRGARAALEQIETLDALELTNALRRLRVPQPRDLAVEHARRSNRPSESQPAQPASGHSAETRKRAAGSLIDARRHLLQPQGRASQSIECFDCPVQNVLDVASWAGIMELTVGHASSYVWSTETDAPRMLIAPGAPPERLPLFWATPAQDFPQLCKLGETTGELTATAAVNGDELFSELIANLKE